MYYMLYTRLFELIFQMTYIYTAEGIKDEIDDNLLPKRERERAVYLFSSAILFLIYSEEARSSREYKYTRMIFG